MTNISNIIINDFIKFCENGDDESIEAIFNTLSLDEITILIEYNQYIGFRIAAKNGYTKIINRIFGCLKSVHKDFLDAAESVIPAFDANHSEGIRNALSNRQIEIVRLMLEEEFLYNKCLDVIFEDLDYIKIIWNSSLQACIFFLFSEVCRINLSSVKQFLEVIPEESHHLLIEYSLDTYQIVERLVIRSGSPFRAAFSSGNNDIVHFLWHGFCPSYRNKVINEQLPGYCISAAKNGRDETIKMISNWLDAEQNIKFLTGEDFSAFIYAADIGNLEIVQHIWEVLPERLRFDALLASNFAAYRLATKGCHCHVVVFLESKVNDDMIKRMKNALNQGVYIRRENLIPFSSNIFRLN